MSAFSNYAEKAILDRTFGLVNWAARPTTLYFALMTAAPSDTGGGTEVSGGGYSRVSLATNTTNFQKIFIQGGSMSNKVAISFPRATAAWGTVTHVAIYDASSGGNLIFWAPLNASKVINEDDSYTWGVGELTWTLGGDFGALMSMTTLNHIFCGITYGTPQAAFYIGLGTSATPAALSGEAKGGGYTRLSFTNSLSYWNTTDVTATPQKTNALDTNFAAATSDWQGGPFTHFAFSLDARKSTSISSGTSSSGLLITTSAAHGLSVNDVVRFHGTASYGGVPPTGLTVDTTDYYVVSVPSSTTFKVSTTLGGASVAYTATGTGQVEKIVSPTTCTASTSTDFFTSASHGLFDGDVVRFYNTTPSNLPTVGGVALDTATDYYVINSTSSTFQIALTAGGTPLDIDGAGSGTHYVIRQNDHIIWQGETGGALTVVNTNQPGWSANKLGVSID